MRANRPEAATESRDFPAWRPIAADIARRTAVVRVIRARPPLIAAPERRARSTNPISPVESTENRRTLWVAIASTPWELPR